MRVLQIVPVFLFCALVLPIALGLTLIRSTPRLLNGVVFSLELFLDLAWLLLAIVVHLVRSTLYAIGVGTREKTLMIRNQARHFAGEIVEDLKKLWGIPLAVAGNFQKSIRQSRAFLEGQGRRMRSLVAPGPRTPPPLPRQGGYDFEKDYEILQRLASGGSTAQLFVVRPRSSSRLVRRGDPSTAGRLVIKYFDLGLGSHLENIVRESGAVQLATRLGMVLDSQMSSTSFYYVMPYYHGASLTGEILAIHRELPEGSSPAEADLKRFLAWLRDLLQMIVAYHEGGVFHKDIKPDNLIVSGERLHLVDIGLLTPLESTLQLTTHGTEYFRDPEMVRLATRGVSIRDVDCAKFDLYSIGGVFYFMVEGAFPASGSLSRYTRRVPFCLQWICNRAMTDFDKRYGSAREMLRDVEDLLDLSRRTPFESIKVSSLSSFQEGAPEGTPESGGETAIIPVAGKTPGKERQGDGPVPPPPGGRPGGWKRLFKMGALILLLVSILAGAVMIQQWAGSDSTRRFRGRIEAAEWAARAADNFRQNISAGGKPILLELPEPGEDPEKREFLREVKLALANRGVPFETRNGRKESGGVESSSSRLWIDASREGMLKRVSISLRSGRKQGSWLVEY